MFTTAQNQHNAMESHHYLCFIWGFIVVSLHPEMNVDLLVRTSLWGHIRPKLLFYLN